LHVLVFDPYAHGDFDPQSCTAFHEQYPSVVLLPYASFYGRSVHDVLRLAHLGVRRLVCRGEDDSLHQLRAIVRASVSDACASRIAAEFSDLLSPELAAFFSRVVSSGGEARDPNALARAYFCHPKTLRQRLRAAGLPPTNKLAVWVRLLHAACLLEDPGRSVESVALALEFPSSSALHKQMRRYTGLSPREVAAGGGLARLAAEFRARLQEGNWELAELVGAGRSPESDFGSSQDVLAAANAVSWMSETR
jgi:AraC-like DNA-binding protein